MDWDEVFNMAGNLAFFVFRLIIVALLTVAVVLAFGEIMRLVTP